MTFSTRVSRSRTCSTVGISSLPTTSSRAPLSLTAYSTSSPAERQFTIALAAPSEPAARLSSTHAGWFLSRKATTSPRPMPSARSPPAARRTRSSHSAQVQLRAR